MRFFLSALVFFLVLDVSAGATSLIEKVTLRPQLTAERYSLTNGLEVVLIPNSRAPSSVITHWVKAGSVHEKAGITGIAHLFEHMMFRPLSPEKLPFFERMKKLGASVNANTRFGATVFTSVVPNENLAQALTIESERFQKLRVTPELLKVEKEAVRSEYSTKVDSSPIIDLWVSLFRLAFKDHPLGWHAFGFRDDLDRITAEDANHFYQKYYRPNNTILIVAGNFNRAKILSKIEQEYGPWVKGEKSEWPKAYVSTQGFLSGKTHLTSKAKTMLVGFRIPLPTPQNHAELRLANYMLLDSDQSLLKKRLYFEKKLVSEVSEFNFDYDWALLEILAILNERVSADKVVTEIMKVNEDLSALSDEDYQAYVKEFQIQIREALLRNISIADLAGLYLGKFGSLTALQDVANGKKMPSKAEMLSFLKPILKKENAVMVVTK